MELDAAANIVGRGQNRYRRAGPGHAPPVRLQGERRRTATNTRVEDGSWSAPAEEFFARGRRIGRRVRSKGFNSCWNAANYAVSQARRENLACGFPAICR